MGLYDRDYTRESRGHAFRNLPQMRMNLPRITPVVKWLLIINIVVFVASFMIKPLGVFFYKWFSVFPASIELALQFWRIITYQFLHDINGFGHIFGNMLVLFFFGPMLERYWGSKKFLIFYLLCGAMGGILYPLLAFAGWLEVGALVGASGAIFGMLAAGAILFPNLNVYIWGIFPIRLIILAIILAVISIMNIFGGENAGGEAAHLAGMAAGAVYVFSESWRAKLRLKLRSDQLDKQMTATTNLQAELDRILQKVHESGIHSLTSKERKTLKRVTELERMRNNS